MIWFEISKYSFYYWNQFRILVYFNLQKSPPGGDFATVDDHWSRWKSDFCRL